MVQFDPQYVAMIVQKRLNKASTEKPVSVRVLTDQVRLETGAGDWWYVPVSYQPDPWNLHKYYDVFAIIEEELEEQENMNVLLVPRVVPRPDVDV